MSGRGNGGKPSQGGDKRTQVCTTLLHEMVVARMLFRI